MKKLSTTTWNTDMYRTESNGQDGKKSWPLPCTCGTQTVICCQDHKY